MNILTVNKIYFIGIGGIGMSALARYFHVKGKKVGGYDKTETPLTNKLQEEGIEVHYKENKIPGWIVNSNHKESLIIYTPAIPKENQNLQYYIKNGFNVMKRSEILEIVTQEFFTIAIAGTHGKTTTTAILAHILKSCDIDCTAFLGGISVNYNTNFLFSDTSKIIVVEADEYDKSFLKLQPDIAVITSVDADHLDIYNNTTEVKNTFQEFAKKVKNEGVLLVNKNIDIDFKQPKDGVILTYSVDDNANFMARNLHVENGNQIFDANIFGFSSEDLYSVKLKLPGKHNVENALAAMAVSCQLGLQFNNILKSIACFEGVKRRYDKHVEGDFVYIDDYAHHPEEVRATLTTTNLLYPNKEITVVFQPHLFSRTKDFLVEFASALSLADEVILLDIYPARERPIKGINSKLLLEQIQVNLKSCLSKQELLVELSKNKRSVLLTLGAGDIDKLVDPIKEIYS